MPVNIVLIEDEKMVSDDLADILQSIDSSIIISKTISSVKEALDYFKTDNSTQLIFSDIQLGDGYSFEIFHALNTTTPVIYCTAYNQHALEAFDNNGIAYVLKPYTRKTILLAWEKYKMLQQTFKEPVNYDDLLATLTGSTHKPQTLLVNSKNKIIPVKISDIACFSVEYKTTSFITFSNQKFSISHTLDELEEICGAAFFRANRQYLINRESIKEVVHYSQRKLFVTLVVSTTEDVIVNKAKSTGFLNWLKG